MRLNSLDYLRGVAAIGIMLFHFFSWTYGEYTSQFMLSRFGLYGVSLFYILSGLTLAHVYTNKLTSGSETGKFFIKRIARILPLLWLVTIITIFSARQHFSTWEILLNLSGLFGFISPVSYIAGGAWSIGNEMVFYVFFPILIFLYKKNARYLHLAASLVFLMHLYFAFKVLHVNQTIIAQWEIYINPFNQLTFFIAGIYMGLYKDAFNLNKVQLTVLFMVSVCIFIFYPVSGNPINLVIGWPRLILTIDCFILTLLVSKLSAIPYITFHQIFKWFGDVSYSLYLIHPLVWAVTLKIAHRISFLQQSNFFNISLGIILTLISSGFVYKYFEVPIIKLVNKKLSRSK
ncbi:acyltransferase [Mucilaginibacter puniceus]